jgi:hypothetical protein
MCYLAKQGRSLCVKVCATVLGALRVPTGLSFLQLVKWWNRSTFRFRYGIEAVEPSIST